MSERPRLLLAWEMGGNFGHLSKIRALLPHLTGKADIVIAAKDPVAARRFLHPTTAAIVPAPVPRSIPASVPDHQPLNYPDDLSGAGWGDTDTLTGLCQAWLDVIDLVKPDALIAQSAPTATLAARARDIVSIQFGTGYDCPPRGQPLPPFSYWEKDPKIQTTAAQREHDVLTTANAALTTIGGKTARHFCDLLYTDIYAITTIAELDHYQSRHQWEASPPPYRGILSSTDIGRTVSWRPNANRRILGYLRHGTPWFDAVLNALCTLPQTDDVILAVPGAPGDVRQKAEGSPVRIIDGPVQLDALLPDCDLGLSHASAATSGVFLLNGIPQIGIPTQTEQLMIARAIGENGFGLGLAGRYGPAQARQAIDIVFSTPSYKNTAKEIAARYAQADLMDAARELAHGILSLCAQRS